MDTTIQQILCTSIVPGSNDRKVFDHAKLEELAASIAQHGLAQPITVRPLPALFGTTYQIVAGERRFRAISKVLGWETCPCIVREMGDEEASAIMLAENTGRADLNPIEEANAYQVRMERFGWSLEKVSGAAGVSQDLVKRRVSLLHLVPEAQHLVAFGNMPLTHAEIMAPLDANRQRIALRIIQEAGRQVASAEFRHIVNELMAEQSQDTLFSLENFWVHQVQQETPLPRRGKHACTYAPTRPDLPPIEQQAMSDTASVIIDRWISSLIQSGLPAEAAAVGTLYTALVHMNYLSVPQAPTLINSQGA